MGGSNCADDLWPANPPMQPSLSLCIAHQVSGIRPILLQRNVDACQRANHYVGEWLTRRHARRAWFTRRYRLLGILAPVM